ncbi:hypothetical protein CPC08DRAFT_69137 [Agrocybe pediades]|nr:hypothetical protein CPC08DRAFT_69137 [Agrocybe pediades]
MISVLITPLLNVVCWILFGCSLFWALARWTTRTCIVISLLENRGYVFLPTQATFVSFAFLYVLTCSAQYLRPYILRSSSSSSNSYLVRSLYPTANYCPVHSGFLWRPINNHRLSPAPAHLRDCDVESGRDYERM